MVLYRSPYPVSHPYSLNSFLDGLSEQLNYVICFDKEFMIFGDFNSHVNNFESHEAEIFLVILASKNVITPTVITFLFLFIWQGIFWILSLLVIQMISL